MADLRAEILKRLAQLDKSRYWLAKRAKLDNTTVYTYLAGERDTNGENIGKMCEALGMELRPREAPKGKARPSRQS